MLSRLLPTLSRRTYASFGNGGKKTFLQAFKETLAHSSEVKILIFGFLGFSVSFCTYQTCYATMAKTEIVTMPYLNKLYHHENMDFYNKNANRISPIRSLRTFEKDGFYSQNAWKEELQELLNEIHGDDKKAYAEATIF